MSELGVWRKEYGASAWKPVNGDRNQVKANKSASRMNEISMMLLIAIKTGINSKTSLMSGSIS